MFMPDQIQNLIDKQAIQEVLVRYTHGIDRCDLDMLKSAYWPDGTDDHGTFSGNAMEFCETILQSLRPLDCTLHTISNILIELRGDEAKVETYCVAYHQFSSPDGPIEMVVAGRYLDHMIKRNDEWRIWHRLYVMDWNRNCASTAQWDGDLYSQLKTRGARTPDDPYDRFMAG
jgi:hypothetical protein